MGRRRAVEVHAGDLLIGWRAFGERGCVRKEFANVRTVKAFSNETFENKKFGDGNEIVF